MTSGNLSIDLSEKTTETLSNVLIQSNRTFFFYCALLSLLVFELGGVVILTPTPTRAKVAETATGARLNVDSGKA